MERALTSKNTTTTNPQQVSAGGQRLEEELLGPLISHPEDEISTKRKGVSVWTDKESTRAPAQEPQIDVVGGHPRRWQGLS